MEELFESMREDHKQIGETLKKTLEKKIEVLKDELSHKINELEKEFMLEKFVLNMFASRNVYFNYIIYTYKSIGFYKESAVHPNGVQSKEDVRKIFDMFPPSVNEDDYFELGFAGKDNIVTESCFNLRVDNYEHQKGGPQAKLKYIDCDGVYISIEMDSRLLDFTSQSIRKDEYSTAKNPELISNHLFANQVGLKCQAYQTGSSRNNQRHYSYHGKAEQFLKIFEE
jgi:hypothetical protein